MRRTVHLFSCFLMLLGALMFFEQRALAYTDPGTGLLAIQAAGSALVAAGWVLRKKVSSLFHRRTTEEERQQDHPAHVDEDSELR